MKRRQINPPDSSDEDSKASNKKAKQEKYGKRKITDASASKESAYGRHKRVAVDNTVKSRVLSDKENGRKGKPTKTVGNRIKNKTVTQRRVPEDSDSDEITDEEDVKKVTYKVGKKRNWRINKNYSDSEEGLDASGEEEDEEDGGDGCDVVEEVDDEDVGEENEEDDGEEDEEDDSEEIDEDEGEETDEDELEDIDEGEEVDEDDGDEDYGCGEGNEDDDENENEGESSEEDGNKGKTKKNMTTKRVTKIKVTEVHARGLRSKAKK